MDEKATFTSLVNELIRFINEVIYVIEQSGDDEYGIDFINFRLDYLNNVVARYVNELTLGSQVLRNIQQARDIISQGHGEQSRPVVFEASTTLSGNRGRPRFKVSREQVEFFLDQNFTSKEISCLLGISESTVKRRIQDFGINIHAGYSDLKCI